MRRAIPYPCWGPIASSVLSAINARVPCQTSVLSAMLLLLDPHSRITHLLLGSNRNVWRGGLLTPVPTHHRVREEESVDRSLSRRWHSNCLIRADATQPHLYLHLHVDCGPALPAPYCSELQGATTICRHLGG